MSSVLTPGVPRWTYTDSDPSLAMRLALTPGFGATQAERVRGVRALMAATASVIEGLAANGEVAAPSKPPSKPTEGVENVEGVDDTGAAPANSNAMVPVVPTTESMPVYGAKPLSFASNDYKLAGAYLARTWLILPPPPPTGGEYVILSVQTHDGDPPKVDYDGLGRKSVKLATDVDTAIVPLVAGLVVVGIAAFTYGMIYIAQAAMPVVDNWITKTETTKRLILAQQSAVKIVGDHADRDAKNGVVTPLTDAEKEAINALRAAQDAHLEQERKTAPPVPQSKPLGDVVSDFVAELPLVAAAGAFLFVATR